MISGAGIDSGIPTSREKIGLSYANQYAERIPDVQIPRSLLRARPGRRDHRRRRRPRAEDRGPEDALRAGPRDQPEPRQLQPEPGGSRVGAGGSERWSAEEGIQGR